MSDTVLVSGTQHWTQQISFHKEDTDNKPLQKQSEWTHNYIKKNKATSTDTGYEKVKWGKCDRVTEKAALARWSGKLFALELRQTIEKGTTRGLFFERLIT